MKKLCRIVMLALMLALAVLPAAAGAQSVKYLDQDGKEQQSPADTVIIDAEYMNGQSGAIYLQHGQWYAVSESVKTGGKRICALGTVHLILCDGATLEIEGGVEVSRKDQTPGKLTLYAQSEGDSMGSLHSDCSGSMLAGIQVNPGQTLIINGGDILAKGGYGAAGIGGTRNNGYAGDSACGEVIIHGGTVTAVGSNGSAGIGGGWGEVWAATSGGEGSGQYAGGKGGTVTITGGTVTAKGSDGAPAIGGGQGKTQDDHGTLYLKPTGGRGFIATDLEKSSQIGLFGSSNENQISSFTGNNKVTHVEFSTYDKAAVDAVVNPIQKLPDPGNYTPGNSAVDQMILDAQSALEAMGEDERALISDMYVEKLAELLKKLGIYVILDGDGQSVAGGTVGTLTVRASGPIAWFEGIQIDGEDVDRDCYTVKAGSTIVTLNPGYVATLPLGPHTLTILYRNGGSVSADFEVVRAPNVANLPKTGDGSRLTGWLALLGVCCAGAWCLTRKRK